MSVEPLRGRRQLLLIPQNACRIISALGGSLPNVGRYRFSLRTTKQGVLVMFHVTTDEATAFSYNVSHMVGHYPPNFKEARKWVAGYLARYGQSAMEIVNEKRQMPRMRGDDAKLFKAGGCKEVWLRSDVPTLFAQAAVRCQHAGGFCIQDGYCHYGDCEMDMEPRPAVVDDDA